MHQHLFLSFLLAFYLKMCIGSEWCYQSQQTCENHCNGPEMWNNSYQACAGKAQSPINIVHRKTQPEMRLTPFEFYNYQYAFTSQIQNNGHYVQVNLSQAAYVTGAGLGEAYKTLQFHLHWGKNGGTGSEHTIDGEKYPMELHIVHIKNQYSNLEEALKDSTGVAVLGFFYQEYPSNNNKYESIVDALQRIKKTGSNTTLSSVSLEQLIPSQQDLTNYYRYNGSLTTPGCTEAVIWTVFEKPISLSRDQLAKFSTLQFKDGKPMVDTFRPVQPLNGREVYRSGGAVVLASATLLLASFAMAMGLSPPN